MRLVPGRISQVAGALLAMGLVLALGVISLYEQRSVLRNEPDRSGLQVSFPRQLITLGKEQPAPYRVVTSQDESIPHRQRLRVHLLVAPGLDKRAVQRVAQVAAAKLLADTKGLSAVAVFVFTSEESRQHGERFAVARLVYAPDGCGWDGAPVGQPVSQFVP